MDDLCTKTWRPVADTKFRKIIGHSVKGDGSPSWANGLVRYLGIFHDWFLSSNRNFESLKTFQKG